MLQDQPHEYISHFFPLSRDAPRKAVWHIKSKGPKAAPSSTSWSTQQHSGCSCSSILHLTGGETTHRSQLATASKYLLCSTSEPPFTSPAQSYSFCPKTRMVVPVFSTQRSLPQSRQEVLWENTLPFPDPPVTEKSTGVILEGNCKGCIFSKRNTAF